MIYKETMTSFTFSTVMIFYYYNSFMTLFKMLRKIFNVVNFIFVDIFAKNY